VTVSESSPNSAPEGDDWPDFDVKKFARETVFAIETGDDGDAVIEDRVIRIEEVIAARWPRRWILRWRLAREIRASVAGYADSFIPRGDFYGRRLQFGSEVAVAERQRRQRISDERRRQRDEAAQQDDARPDEGILP
jgi:hypothetical protein